MKGLLLAIQTQLQQDLSYIRDSDIYITGDMDSLPSSARLPAVALKDGNISRKELAGQMMEVGLNVSLVIWVEVFKEDAALIGDTTRKGILDIAEELHAALDENLLGIEGIIEAFSPSELASEPFNDGNRDLQRKQIVYQYIKETARPSQT